MLCLFEHCLLISCMVEQLNSQKLMAITNIFHKISCFSIFLVDSNLTVVEQPPPLAILKEV